MENIVKNINSKVRADIIKAQPNIKKSVPSNIKPDEDALYSDWITPPFPLYALADIVEHSSIIPQCINAYMANIAGFGLGVRYKKDATDVPTLESEFGRLENILQLLSLDCDCKEIFEKVIRAREIFGIAYLEIIRNSLGEVEQIEFIEDVPSIQKSRRLDEPCEYNYFHDGKAIKRKKQFRKYRQTINQKTVYFKEFGDKRFMNRENGEFCEVLPDSLCANEILEFKLGDGSYGQVRWIGQMLAIDGSRKAENLNNNYFENGRHTPMAVLIKGGTLTEESFGKLRDYMDDIKGEAGQHSFLLLEAENNDTSPDFADSKPPEIDIKNLADILQHDELFQDYLENNRKKIQSSFRLPDLYVGYTNDFNRATAQTAMEVTEKQVFQTERQSLAWIINNKLLNEYGFQNVEVYFKEPDITNTDYLAKLLSICNDAGGITPNKAKEIAYRALGEVSDDFNEDWGNVPVVRWKRKWQPNSIL